MKPSESISKWSVSQQRLVLDILNHSDMSVMELIAAEQQKFLKLIDADGDKVGTKWDDIIIRFEWIFNFQKIMSDTKYDQKSNGQAKDAIREAG